MPDHHLWTEPETRWGAEARWLLDLTRDARWLTAEQWPRQAVERLGGAIAKIEAARKPSWQAHER